MTVTAVDHKVRISRSFYSVEYGSGELMARCTCGWWDTRNYQHDPVTQNRAPAERFAQYKLECAAKDHVPGGAR